MGVALDAVQQHVAEKLKDDSSVLSGALSHCARRSSPNRQTLFMEAMAHFFDLVGAPSSDLVFLAGPNDHDTLSSETSARLKDGIRAR